VRGIERMARKMPIALTSPTRLWPCSVHYKKSTAWCWIGTCTPCVTTAIRGNDPEARERVIGEIMDVFEATGKL